MGKFKPLNQNGLEPFRAGFWVERGVGFTPKRGFSVSWADDEQHGRRRRRRFARSRWGRRCEFQAWSKNLHWKIKKKRFKQPQTLFCTGDFTWGKPLLSPLSSAGTWFWCLCLQTELTEGSGNLELLKIQIWAQQLFAGRGGGGGGGGKSFFST